MNMFTTRRAGYRTRRVESSGRRADGSDRAAHMSDGRDLWPVTSPTSAGLGEAAVAAALQGAGHDVVRVGDPVWTTSWLTVSPQIADARPDLTIFYYPVWAFRISHAGSQPRRPVRCCCSATSTRSSRAWSGLLAGAAPRPDRPQPFVGRGRINDRAWSTRS